MKGKGGPVLIVPWRCTYACDSKCVHCVSAGKKAVPDEINTQDAKKIVDQVEDFGATFLGITGGQPFLRKDLFEVLDYATEKGLGTSIITDGRLLDDEAFKNIVKNQTKISISIDGAEKTNDAIRGKGAYKAAISAVERFSQEKLLNVLVYTFANAGDITNVNEADMRHVLNLAKKYGARWVVFHGMIPYSNDKATLKADPSPTQYEWACNKLYDLTAEYNGKPAINVYIPFYARVAKQRGMPDFEAWFNGFFLGRCFFGKFMSIAENGDAIPCSYNDAYRVGNIKNKPIKQIWTDMQNSEFFNQVKDKANIKGKCGVCEYKPLCGGCRSAALYYTGDILGSDPRCCYIPQILRKNKMSLTEDKVSVTSSKTNEDIVGVVIDNKDPANRGRVKLKFSYLDKTEVLSWVSAGTLKDGNITGTSFIPQVGDEVLIAFIQGDPRQPYVIGELWNGKDSPPETEKAGKNDKQIKSRMEDKSSSRMQRKKKP